MHYSDTYSLIKKLKNKTVAHSLKQALENLETETNKLSFIEFLKQQQEQKTTLDIFKLRVEYDGKQLSMVILGIGKLKNLIAQHKKTAPGDSRTLDKIEQILNDIQLAAEGRYFKIIGSSEALRTSAFSQAAQQYATHYIPFDQANDPFKGRDFGGYCWGHTHEYGRLISQQSLNQLSDASSKTLYEDFKRNWTFCRYPFPANWLVCTGQSRRKNASGYLERLKRFG